MYYNFKPVNFKEANHQHQGFELPEEKRHLSLTNDVAGLPSYFDGEQRITIWKCSSLMARLKFLFKGEVNLIELTENPRTCPKTLSIGKAFISHS